MTPAQIGYSILGVLYLIYTYFAVSGMFPADPKDGIITPFIDVRFSGMFILWCFTFLAIIVILILFFCDYMNTKKLWHKKLW